MLKRNILSVSLGLALLLGIEEVRTLPALVVRRFLSRGAA